MRRSIRSRLLLSFLGVILIAMAMASVMAWLSVEGSYLQTQRENLLAQASLTAAALQGQPLSKGEFESYNQVQNTAPGIHTHLLGDLGTVINLTAENVSDQVSVPPAENSGPVAIQELLNRPEIKTALSGQAVTAIRRVAAAGGRRVLYAAAPVLGQDGAITGVVYLAMPLPAGGLPPSLLLRLGGTVLVAILLATFAGLWLARRIARPVERIAHAAEAVSQGDLDSQVQPDSGIGEVDRLAQTFNVMTASLRGTNQAKNAFIADVTHELRTPLTVIKGTIETLEDGALDDSEGRGALLSSMHAETNRLIRLVNDLLVLTRADAGMLNLKPKSLDLVALTGERCRRLSALAARRDILLQVITVSDSPLPWVAGDPDRLAQVLDNLLDNAIRYSPDGSTVTVSLRVDGSFMISPGKDTPATIPAYSKLVCAVQDYGTGIPVKHLPFIFDRFYRVDASRDRQTGGAGLGLAIARALVLAHGGDVHAQSSEGEGTTVEFWLPISPNRHPTG